MPPPLGKRRRAFGGNSGKIAALPFNILVVQCPYISTAEAFVRHNAHDCIYSDHEKDFRVLQLFVRRFMQGRVLVVLRLSHHGVVEIDTVKGSGAIECHGLVVIHRGHMRAARCTPAQIKQLLEIVTRGERIIRDLEVVG